jgi:hypothetical protein
MIPDEVQYRNTEAHLRQFQEALQDLEAASLAGRRGKLAQLEIDTVRTQADDLRAERSTRWPAWPTGPVC